jgi:hypothetical protein
MRANENDVDDQIREYARVECECRSARDFTILESRHVIYCKPVFRGLTLVERRLRTTCSQICRSISAVGIF